MIMAVNGKCKKKLHSRKERKLNWNCFCRTVRKERKWESLWYSCLTGLNDPEENSRSLGIALVSIPAIIDLYTRNFLNIANNSLWSAGLENRLWNNSRPKRGAPLSQPFYLRVNWDREFVGRQSCNQYLPQTNYKHFNRRKAVREWSRRKSKQSSTRSREAKGIWNNFSKIIIFKSISLRVCSQLNAFWCAIDDSPIT